MTSNFMDNKLKTYETICLTKVDMPEDKFVALVDRCKAAIANEGKGEWLYSDDWGKAKISFIIGKDTRAKWTYMRFKSKPEGIDELLRSLSINEFVLRQITCRTKEDGTDYDSYRANIMTDIAERGERPRDWKEERGSRYGNRREYGDRGGDRDANGPMHQEAAADDMDMGADSAE
ncbi:MAG: 30S ribosomal protein S6 [Bdellovibrionales bacterium]|nr:30S ribosomal protein S6 [Bdellovibrionales bacterium]